MDYAEQYPINRLVNRMISNGNEQFSDVNSRLCSRMRLHIKEFLFLFAILFTLLAAFQNGTTTRKVGPPTRFFPITSLVIDYAFGNLRSLSAKIREQEISFVMYYAPWDARSIQARDEFEETAKYFHDQIFFASINCWWSEGECRTFHKLKSYPIFMAYLVDGSAIEFKAPLNVENLISFLHHVINPYIVIHNDKQLIDAQMKYQAIMVSYFNFKSTSNLSGFNDFVKASYKYLETDPFQETRFAIVSNSSLAKELKIISSPRLFLWNATKKYPHSAIEKNVLIKWLNANVNFVVKWISVSGMKSTALWNYLKNNLTIIFFTPRNHLVQYSPYLNAMKQLSVMLSSCDSPSSWFSLINSMQKMLNANAMKLRYYKNYCKDNVRLENHVRCYSFNYHKKLARCSICVHCPSRNKYSNCSHLTAENVKQINSNFESFASEDSSMTTEINCENYSDFSSVTSADDKIRKMISSNEKIYCKSMKYFFQFNSPPNLNDFMKEIDEIKKISCGSNKTFNVIAMDSLLYSEFAQKFGVNFSSTRDKTAALILSPTDEVQHILHEVTVHNLVKFMVNYTQNNLDRYYRNFDIKNSCKNVDSNSVCVEDIDGKNFHSQVIDNNQDVIVLYYTKWCGFCHGIFHIFLYAAEYFKSCKKVKFLRVNGEDNDFPWQFVVSKYPSIFIFPGDGKDSSVQFPSHLQITELNLIEFVISYAQPFVRQFISIDKCHGKCLKSNYESALQRQTTLNHELQKLMHKTNNFKKHNCFVSSKQCTHSKSNNAHLNYLNEIFENKRREIKINQHLVNFIPSILNGEKNKEDLLDAMMQ